MADSQTDPSDTAGPDPVILALLKVFRTHGWAESSLSLLSQAAGLGRSSLYHRFPQGKADMGRAVMDSLARAAAKHVIEPLSASGAPEDRLRTACEGLRVLYEDGQTSCLLNLFSVGEARTMFGDDLRERAASLQSGFAVLARSAGHSAAEAEDRAERAMIEIEGALVVSRVKEEPSPFHRMLARLPALLLG